MRFRWRWLLWSILAALVAVGLYLWFVPNVSPLTRENPLTTAYMERQPSARSGVRQSWVPLKRISPYLAQAVLIAEDDRFFRHHGVDWEMTWQAWRANLDAGRIKLGGSTITQQLARNLFLSPERSYIRKIREMIIALRLELALDKTRILEIYLNVVEWGSGVYGAEAAAKHYYKVRAADLTPWQAASLAAMLPSPRRYLPSRPTRALARRIKRIHRIMAQRGFGTLWK